jgi:ubiquinone/menaquinone biosynthesis methyltransferase
MISKTNSKINNSEKFFRICSSAENIPFSDNTFDYYTISFGIRNVTDIKKSISEAFRVLKYNGRFLCLEFSKIENFYVKKLYEKYSKLLPHLGKLILGEDKPYTYLVESIDKFYNQNDLLNILRNSGFQNVKYRNLMSGIATIHSGWKI